MRFPSHPRRAPFLGLSALLIWGTLAGCASEEHRFTAPLEVDTDLAAHTAEFERGVVQVTDGVWVAIGYALANSILLEGDDGAVVVDTTESLETGREVLAAFAEVSDKPIRALVYTHNHADHIMGARAFAPDGQIDVYAHETTSLYIDRIFTVVRPIIGQRAMRMFGNYLDRDALVNCGIGPFLAIGRGIGTTGLIRPNKTFRDRLEVEIAGLKLELVHAPGETNDQLFVYLPEKKVLLPGDNFYRAFPNLYTIRGTPYRDVAAWARSLDTMRERRPEFLVPSHTRPLSGAATIEDALRDYRDAIQYVHDQTIRGMNQGLLPDELVELVRLPPHLASSPYLTEFYGKVEWSVRSIFDGYLGWYSGNPSALHPLPLEARAERMARLAGGEDRLLGAAEEAASAGDHAWVLELTDHLLHFDAARARARELRVATLTALGEAESNPNARHYYLTRALEIRDGFTIVEEVEPSEEMVREIPLAAIFNSMAVHLDPAKSVEVDQRVVFHFPDVESHFTVHVRRGVAEVRPFALDDPDIEVTVDSSDWKAIAVGMKSPAWAYASGKIEVEGGTFDLVGFLGLFQSAED